MNFILAPITGFLACGTIVLDDPPVEPVPDTTVYRVTNLSSWPIALITRGDCGSFVLQPGKTFSSELFDYGQLMNLKKLKLIRVKERAE